MKITLLLSLLMMAGLFLLLFAGVALIQDKKYFTTAPKIIYQAIQPKKKRFHGQYMLGYTLAVFAGICMASALILGALNGIKQHFNFQQFFTRFTVMLLLLKLFDIIFFDWFLLCQSNFFSHFYPEVKNILGPHLFGYNKKEHLQQTIAILIISLGLAGLCTLF